MHFCVSVAYFRATLASTYSLLWPPQLPQLAPSWCSLLVGLGPGGRLMPGLAS